MKYKERHPFSEPLLLFNLSPLTLDLSLKTKNKSIDLKKFIIHTTIAVNLVIISAMLVTGFADMLDPRSWPVMTTAGYAFPLFALANLGMIVIWMFISKKHILIPFLGFVICYVPVTQYCPVHASGEVPLGALKIMTYNTWGFGSQRESGNDEEAKKEARRNILQYIADEDCHVVCIQEGIFHKAMEADIDSIIKPKMPYLDTCKVEGGTMLMVLALFRMS